MLFALPIPVTKVFFNNSGSSTLRYPSSNAERYFRGRYSFSLRGLSPCGSGLEPYIQPSLTSSVLRGVNPSLDAFLANHSASASSGEPSASQVKATRLCSIFPVLTFPEFPSLISAILRLMLALMRMRKRSCCPGEKFGAYSFI